MNEGIGSKGRLLKWTEVIVGNEITSLEDKDDSIKWEKIEYERFQLTYAPIYTA